MPSEETDPIEPTAPGARRISRIATGLGAGTAAVLVVVATLGLATGRPIGAEDNGDGYRLYCGLGLTAQTIDRLSVWKGGVVSAFAVGEPSCGMSVPSSAGLLLRLASLGADGVLAMSTVATWYAVLAGVVVGLAAWAASATGLTRAAIVAVPAAPLALAPFTRFFASTYGEPAGLLGTLAVGCGLAVLAVVPLSACSPDRRSALPDAIHGHRARGVAVGLVGAGAVVAGSAKVAYIPVLLVAAGVLAVVALRSRARTPLHRRDPRRVLAGAVAAVVAVGAAAVPVAGAMHFQQKIYEGANVHNVVFTMALAELGPGGPAALGLPPEASAVVGDGFFNGAPRPTDEWWVRAIQERSPELRRDAVLALASDPAAGLRALGVGLQSTTRADLTYLAATPADPDRPSAPAGHVGWSGSGLEPFRATLDASPGPPWVPTALVLTALAAAASTLLWGRRAPAVARWCRAAGVGAVAALGLVGAALVGDGYFEVFKHVWLAAYVLAVTGLCLVGAAVAAAGTALRAASRRAEPREEPRTEPRTQTVDGVDGVEDVEEAVRAAAEDPVPAAPEREPQHA